MKNSAFVLFGGIILGIYILANLPTDKSGVVYTIKEEDKPKKEVSKMIDTSGEEILLQEIIDERLKNSSHKFGPDELITVGPKCKIINCNHLFFRSSPTLRYDDQLSSDIAFSIQREKITMKDLKKIAEFSNKLTNGNKNLSKTELTLQEILKKTATVDSDNSELRRLIAKGCNFEGIFCLHYEKISQFVNGIVIANSEE